GQINNISSFQVVTNDNPHITIVCQKGWTLAYQNNIPKILYGNWLNGTSFEINFINQTKYGYNPVLDNIRIIPEPASMLLLGLGGVLIKKRRRQ
ncbi:MAG: PEP-CTERM sorting domain-containing protein, partial [Sedimentisphaerales bacterium]|nr:PEP-CTERM sorting domain-containing protein [Sedimentisphaerales bacterium]